VLPATDPPSAAAMCSTIWCLRVSLKPTVVSISEIGATASRAVLTTRSASLRDQRQLVLGEAGAAIARARMQELRPDAAVEPDAARHVVHVGADLVAQVRNLVDVRDLHRQEGVGGILDEFGGFEVGEQDRRLDQEQ